MFKLILLCIIFLLPVNGGIYSITNPNEIDEKVIKIFNMLLPNEKISIPPTIKELNYIAQKNFLRPKGAERSSKEASVHYEGLFSIFGEKKDEKLNEVIKLFEDLGYLKEVLPPLNDCPNYVVILGSTIQNLRERLNFVAKLVEQQRIDISKSEIIFSLGDRGLFPCETKEVLMSAYPYAQDPAWKAPNDLPNNENDMGDFIWNQMQLPPTLKNKQPIFLKTLKAKDASRATTETCAETFWEQQNIKPGKVLLISSNPFIEYQVSIFKLALKRSQRGEDKFQVTGAGPGGDTKQINDKYIKVGAFLDNLARTLYVINQNIESQGGQ